MHDIVQYKSEKKNKFIKKCLFKLVTIDSHVHWVTIAGTNVLKLPTIRKISFSMHIFDLPPRWSIGVANIDYTTANL